MNYLKEEGARKWESHDLKLIVKLSRPLWECLCSSFQKDGNFSPSPF